MEINLIKINDQVLIKFHFKINLKKVKNRFEYRESGFKL